MFFFFFAGGLLADDARIVDQAAHTVAVCKRYLSVAMAHKKKVNVTHQTASGNNHNR